MPHAAAAAAFSSGGGGVAWLRGTTPGE